MSRPLLELKKVNKTYDDLVAVDEVSFTVKKGDIFGLLGGSGCGKTTLLRIIAGFTKPDSGQVQLDGEDLIAIPPYKRKVNMMFQSYALFPHLSVANNIAFGLKQDRLPRTEIKQRVDELLKLVEMELYANRKPYQLSGGQRQRVALARSLAKKPMLLLLDEPMAALDKKLRTQMQLEIVNIIEEVGVTCILVTHDQEEAMTMCSRIAVMADGEILQLDKPSLLYEYPTNRAVAEFFGMVNIFTTILKVDQSDHSIFSSAQLANEIYLPYGVSGSEGMEMEIALRPEKLTVSKKKPRRKFNWQEGRVEEIAYLGSNSIYHIRLASGFILLASVANTSKQEQKDISHKDKVYVHWKGENCVVLGRE